MNRRLTMLAVLIAILFISVNVFAQANDRAKGDSQDNPPAGLDYKKTPINKLSRGVINGVTCWFEVPIGMTKVTNDTNNIGLGLTAGTVVGLGNTVVRFASGAFDIITCVIPPYQKSLIKPEYVFQQKPGDGLFAQLQALDDKLQEDGYLW